MDLNVCSVCGRQGKTLQCSRCHSKRYCSVDCQKKDWKAGHRHLCGPPQNGVAPPPTQKQAHRAYKELMALTTSMNTSEAKEQLDRANDEFVKNERKEHQDIKNARRDAAHPRQEAPTATVNSTGKVPPKTSVISCIQSNFTVRIAEEMQHISQYHVTLERKNTPGSGTLVSKEWTHSIVHEKDNASQVILKSSDNSDIVEVRLPRRILSCQLLPGEQPNHLVLRLSYDDASESPLPHRGKLPMQEAINTIQCLACSQTLLPSCPIKRAAELPVGCWDEIADYLICYSGQSVVDFTVASAAPERGLVLQDSNVLCFHPKDLGNSVCVLAVPGYGERESPGETESNPKTVEDAPATIRGDRLWRDITGGATVCCSVCCVRLGFASVEAESFRLLKHRLSITDPNRDEQEQGSSQQQMSTCASFLAREMVRYAESKAIFTFVVSRESTTDPTRLDYNTKCILLRLVSWDSNIATCVDASNSLVFRSYAKMVFEETYDRERQDRTNGQDPMSWVWGGVDLCCPPESGGPLVFNTDTDTTERLASQASSSVRLELSSEEYDELLTSLQGGTQLFSKSVSDATVLVKMGPSALSQSHNGMSGLGLTAIPLE